MKAAERLAGSRNTDVITTEQYKRTKEESASDDILTFGADILTISRLSKICGIYVQGRIWDILHMQRKESGNGGL